MSEIFDPGYTGTVIEHPEVGVRIGLMEVTPELAREWLDERNVKNRPIGDTTVRAYIRDILNDAWPFTGDPVRFSDDGALLDGQHRLTAMVKTETSMILLVISGLDKKTQEYMDGGRKRNAADALAMEDVPNYATVASVVKLALTWNPGGIWSPTRGTTLLSARQPVTTSEILDFVRRTESVHEAARQGQAVFRAIPGARPSVIGAAYLRAMMLPEGVFGAAEWFHKLETGANLSVGDPILSLRNGLARVRDEKLTNPQVPQLYKIVRAWNASRDGETLGRIIMPKNALDNDNFPDMR